MSTGGGTADSPDMRLYADYLRFLKEFQNESDRAAVVLGAAYVDAMLLEALERVLPHKRGGRDRLLAADGPLGALGARITLVERLGLIDRTLADALRLLKDIRNPFAHLHTKASLADGPLADKARTFVDYYRSQEFFEAAIRESFTSLPAPSAEFRAAVALLCLELEVYVKTLDPPEWELMKTISGFAPASTKARSGVSVA